MPRLKADWYSCDSCTDIQRDQLYYGQDIEKKGDKILLEREFPSEFFRKEYPLTEKYLPERCEIDKIFVNGRSVCVSDSDKTEIEDLMRKFVVINVPEKYIR